MPFDPVIAKAVDSYARQDLHGGLSEHVEFFSFLADDPELRWRLGEEYYSARYIYKLLEGLRIGENWARRAQVQLQVQQYASIYEACIHHLLFVRCADRPEVKALLERPTLREYSVNQKLRDSLAAVKAPQNRQVVAAVEAVLPLDETKVRFDSKARAACTIGIIDDDLTAELIEFYAARNMIHVHAELKRGADWSWEINFARQAYWRLHKFKDQVLAWMDSSSI
jgi:hypothetical protein